MAEANKQQNEVTDEQFAAAVFEEGGNLVIDMGGIAEAKFENVPKGIYAAEIDVATFEFSKNSGAPMIALTVAISEGQYQGRKLFTYWSFSQKALPYTKATIMRIAPDILANGRFSPQEVCDAGTLIGKPCRIKVGMQEYQGEQRSRIEQMLGPNTGDAMSATVGNGAGGTKFF